MEPHRPCSERALGAALLRRISIIQAARRFGITLAELATVFEARPGLDRQRPRRPTDHPLRGHTPATQAAAMPLPLTDREREIAILISQGLSNIDIAQPLTLSVRTIEGHIHRACARVGTATRTELAQLISEFAPARGSSLH